MIIKTMRRLRDMIIVLAVLAVGMFLLLRIVPGGPARAILGEYASEDQVRALQQQMGLERPLLVQMADYLSGLIKGDLGTSFVYSRSVTSVILDHAGPSLVIAIGSTVLSVIVSIPLAALAASRPGSPIGRAVNWLTSLGIAIPDFWLAMLMTSVFAVGLRIVPVSGYISIFDAPLEGIPYIILPILALTMNQFAVLTVTLQESISAELGKQYMQFARSNGVKETRILFGHALPNSLLPFITLTASTLGQLLGGIVIIETIFSIPGWGYTLWNSVVNRDYNMVVGLTLLFGVLFVTINFLADMFYLIIDPRQRKL